MATPRLPSPPGPVPVSSTTDGAEPVIPREVGAPAAAVLGGLRECVAAWTERSSQARGLGYHPAVAEVDPEAVPELLVTVEALLRLVTEEAPDSDTAEAVGLGCFQIAEWAEERGALATALSWAQLAIAAWPQQPHYAYLIGRLARKRAQYPHAEEWLRYAMRIARRRMSWEVYALALSGFANLKRQRGNMPVATRYHRLALKAATRHGLRTLEGDALYDLAVIAIEAGDARGAIALGREALRAYGPGHVRVLRLAHDFAWLLMTNTGDFFHAACILQSLVAHVWEPPFRLLLLANLCRASAGCDWEALFEKSWVDTWTLIRQTPTQEGHAGSLLQLAYAAGRIGSWERARMAAEQAAFTARQRQEGTILFEAEEVLDAIRDSELEPERMVRAAPDLRWLEIGEEHASLESYAVDLVDDIALTLRVRRDGAPESPLAMLIG
ncbi:MAG: hypothetical protein JWM27_4772 [Gemmatimonadetes bacterium]|nr:hypothetical protein [Gemmatimonadota bacterium]